MSAIIDYISAEWSYISGVKIKEPFLLFFSIIWILGALLPRQLYRRRSGIPYENQRLARAAFLAIGVALLVLWYSLPGK
jgi:hypothetical protein